ncbi:amidase signature domain-containing protein [Phascolomyces articulosus]|uniref:Amidase signature domain-containing protein n=1 Tax=Phascolomyces articulosus TaxID=60185 RepID=A0AAD5PGH3_9FUNG|nr:amidase signature domain-containing protein [Phascolomyces articulosus]
MSDEKFDAPALYGLSLAMAANLVDRVPLAGKKIARDARMFNLRNRTLVEMPTLLPIPHEHKHSSSNVENTTPSSFTLNIETKSKSPFYSFWDYHLAYKEQKTTPTKVAQALLKVLEESNPKYHWMRAIMKTDSVLNQAAESTTRYKDGKPLSQLDGVFVSIKEEMNIQGFETKGGTSFINNEKPAESDAEVVRRLREAGAIIIGQTVMQELGWDVFTVNPNTGTPLNPYDLVSSCGGSSGGSSATVAAGLVPISIGADAGGSVRIPSSFCGLYGLKTTFGRLSSSGGLTLTQTLDVYGPIAATADDLTITYLITAGPDIKDPNTLYQPSVSFDGYSLTENLEGITIATIPQWESKIGEPEILDHIRRFQKHFEHLGAKIVEVELPSIDLVGTAHAITICSEMNTFAEQALEGKPKSNYTPSTRVMMAISEHISAQDYYKAQQVRTQVIEHLSQVFKKDKVDLLLLPTTAITAPELPQSAFRYGMSDTVKTTGAMVYATLANFTGLPALSVPAGFHNNKPVGMQLIGEWWNEALLLRMAKVCEKTPEIERKHPEKQWFGHVLDDALKQ